MSIAFVGQAGAGTSVAGGTSFAVDMPTAATITPGNTLIATVAYRDAITPPTDQRPQPGNQLAVDTRGNLWRREAYSINAGATGAADDGAVLEIWVCHVVFPYVNGDDIVFFTPITGFPMTAVAVRITEFSGVKRVSHPYSTISTSGNGTAVSVTPIAVARIAQLVFAAAAVASNPTLTGDADTTDGSWSAIDQATSGAAGIRRGEQYKIVTGTTNQSWDVTWTGAQRWAAAAVVLEEQETAWPFNNARLANPEFPCPAGPQIIPVARTSTPVDTGTGYIFEADLPPESSDTESMFWYSDVVTTDPAADSQHVILAEVYPRGQEQVLNPSVTVNLGVPNLATLANGATTTAGTAVAALATVGGNQVILETQQTVDCAWDTSGLIPYASYRVLNARINYVAWKDDSAAAEPGEGLAVRWVDTTAASVATASNPTVLHGAWLVNDYQVGAKRVYRDLGEINGIPRVGVTSFLQYFNVGACFTVEDFLRMQTGATLIRFFGLSGSAPSQETVFLDTVELELELVPERRLANVARRVSSGVGFPNGNNTLTGPLELPFFDAQDTLNFWRTPTYYPDVDVQAISMVVREGLPPSPSDWFSAQYDPTNVFANFGQNIRYASQERVGPSMAIRTVVQPRPTIDSQVAVSRVAWTDGQIAPNAVPMEYGQFLQATALFDANSYQAAWPAYSYDNALQVGASLNSGPTMEISTGTGSTYDYLRVIVAPPDSPVSANLTITVEQPALTVLATATLTWADVVALPAIANDYREVLVPLSATIAPSSTSVVTIRFTSLNPNTDPWIIALGITSDIGARYSYYPFPLSQPVDTDDYAVMLCCPLPAIDADIETTEIETQDSGTACVVPAQDIPCITINNATDYDWITIERTISGQDLAPLALIDVNEEVTYPSLEVYDDFSRIVPTSWGSANTGQLWVETSSAAFVTSVTGVRGVVNPSGNNRAWYGNILSPSADTVQEALVDIPATPTGGGVTATLRARSTSTSPLVYNGYELYARWNTNGSIDLFLVRIAAGSSTTMASYLGLNEYLPGIGLRMKLSVIGTEIKGKAWLETQSEPDWMLTASNALYSAAGQQGVGYGVGSGNTSPDDSLYVYEYSQYSYADQAITFCDYGVPWDIPAGQIVYSVVGYRDVDRRVTAAEELIWTGVSTAPGAAFGIATDDALYAYVPGSDSGPLQVTWSPLTPQDSLPLAGKDYQIALRPVENRGLATTVNVIVNKFGKCVADAGDAGIYDEDLPYDSDGAYDYPGGTYETISPGAKSMTPKPYEDVLNLERIQRVRLKLPGGHTRSVFVDTGALVITPVVGLYMAELTFVDTPPLDIDPWA